MYVAVRGESVQGGGAICFASWQSLRMLTQVGITEDGPSNKPTKAHTYITKDMKDIKAGIESIP